MQWSKPAVACRALLKGREVWSWQWGRSVDMLRHQADLSLLWKWLIHHVAMVCLWAALEMTGIYFTPKSQGQRVTSQGEQVCFWASSFAFLINPGYPPFQVSTISDSKQFKHLPVFWVEFTLMWSPCSLVFYGNQMFCQHFPCYVHQLRKPDALVGLFNVTECCFLFRISEVWQRAIWPWCPPFPNLLIVLATTHILIQICSPVTRWMGIWIDTSYICLLCVA